MWRAVLALILAAALVAGLFYTGIAERFGAHPFWAVKVGFLGLIPGLIAGIIMSAMRISGTSALALSGLLLAASFATAKVGAARFAASYAEEALSGRMWYFGWIAIAACITLLVQQGVRHFLRARG